MQITLNWLKTYLDTDANLDVIEKKLTQIGLEVEEVVNREKLLKPFIVAEIIEAGPHPKADKLKVCKVNNGKEILQIVCGAPNARQGIKVVLAPIGAIIPTNNMQIKASKIRDVESKGMLCSAEELGIEGGHDGIIELPVDASMGAQAIHYLNVKDSTIEIAITPNRGDCLGIYGVARDLAAAGIGTLRPIEVPNFKPHFTSPINVKVVDINSLCPLLMGCYIKNIQNRPSPKWLQDILRDIGQQSINAVVDITNYICHSFGRPLHAYDADKIKGSLIARKAKASEKFLALNNKEYSFAGSEVVISDDEKILGMAGIIGGIASSSTLETTNIFLESALFDRINIAKSGRLHTIDSDARYRFERGVDPLFVEKGLSLAVKMILDICGGEVSSYVSSNQLGYQHQTMDFNVKKIESLGGIEMPVIKIKEILGKLGFEIVSEESQTLKLLIPSWRQDIEGQADIVEEIIRIHGYENISPVAMPYINGEANNIPIEYKNMNLARKKLAMRGLSEVITWSFMSSEKAALFGELRSELKLQNPINSELDYMRPSIIANLLEALKKNQFRNYNDISLFEIGPVFDNIDQQYMVASGIRSGKNNQRNIYNDYRDYDVFDVKADLIAVLSEIGINENNLRSSNSANWYHPGRSESLYLGKMQIACYGELHPKILRALDIKNRVVGFEIYLHNIDSKIRNKRKAFVVSDYQAVTRDYAFMLGCEQDAISIVNAVKALNEKIIQDIQLFDVYINEQDAEAKKSVAITVTMQAEDHTLNEEEIMKLSDAIISSVKAKTGAELRV
ncbi:Phenylalanine--tRNA ligase beta subunit [Rickettsiales bacterium Ac37b]|nr:Phenylalanine--tRNA ligase beta subunit [Rickettsiales bacterium Ac37b]